MELLDKVTIIEEEEDNNNEPPSPHEEQTVECWESEGDYKENDYSNFEDDYYYDEDDAWEMWLADARLRAKTDPNAWPPLIVPQSRSELLSVLYRPHYSPKAAELLSMSPASSYSSSESSSFAIVSE